MIRDLPPATVPDSLHSVLAGAGYGPPPTEDPVVPETTLLRREDATPEPVLTEAGDADLPPEPAVGDASDPEAADEADRLDPARSGMDDDEQPAPGAGAVRPRGPVASLAVHAVVLLAFFDWGFTPVDPPQPIPVTMVIEQPKPDPGKEQAQPQPPPAPEGRLASEDHGDPTTKESDAGAPAPAEAPKADPAPAPPQPEQKPPQQAAPKPAKERLVAMIPPPKPTPPAPPQPKPEKETAAPPHPAETPHRAPHQARVPGPSATRDEYLAYLLVLTKQHLDLLPRAAIDGRSGETIVGILVLDDGTIARIGVAQSSGYPDIDSRIEKMVAAVGRFPPLPQWYQGPRVELTLRLRFPEALEE